MFQIQVQYREKVRQFYVKEILAEYFQIIENIVTNINSDVPMIEITRKLVDFIYISSAQADFFFFRWRLSEKADPTFTFVVREADEK